MSSKAPMEFRNVSLRLPKTTYERIQYFAQQDGIPARAWINQALKSSVNGWREADEDGNYMRRVKKSREKKTSEQEADSINNEPKFYKTKKECVAAYKEHAGPQPTKGYFAWVEGYEVFKDEFFRP